MTYNLASSAAISNGSITSTGSSIARALATRFSSIANALDYGADPTGVSDSTTAINAAAASTVGGVRHDVYLPAGSYSVTNALTIGNGQTLYGDGRGLTTINVTTTFNSSTSGVIVLTGREQQSPTIRDLTIAFAQPPDTVTTTTGTSSIGTNTITVTSTANIIVNGSVRDTTASAAIPANTTISSIVGNVITLSTNIVSPGVGSGDSIHFGPSRSTFATLASGGTATVGGSGVKYPPAIFVSTSNRFKIYDIEVAGAWDGIIANTTTGGIGGYFINNVEMGALNVGLNLDQSFDFGHISDYHFWNFGLGGNLSSAGVFGDGQTVAATFGLINGLVVDGFSTFIGSVIFNSNASTGWFEFTNLQLDQAQLQVLAAQWLQIGTVYIVRGTPATAIQNNINVSGGITQIGNLFCTTNVSFPTINVTAGRLSIYGGTLGNQFSSAAQTLATVSGGILELDNVILGASSGTPTLITQTGGAGNLIVNNCQFPTNVTGTGITIATDSLNNSVQGNNFNGWTFVPPGNLGSYANIVPNGTVGNVLQSEALSVINTGTNGANIALYGNGGTTPNKFIRATGGNLSFLNSAYSGQILTVSDGGNLILRGPLTHVIRIVTASGTITQAATDSMIIVNKTTGAATAVTLITPANPGVLLTIKDGKGDAGTNNITITPAAGTIDGAATVVINANYGVWRGIYNGTQWNTI